MPCRRFKIEGTSEKEHTRSLSHERDRWQDCPTLTRRVAGSLQVVADAIVARSCSVDKITTES